MILERRQSERLVEIHGRASRRLADHLRRRPDQDWLTVVRWVDGEVRVAGEVEGAVDHPQEHVLVCGDPNAAVIEARMSKQRVRQIRRQDRHVGCVADRAPVLLESKSGQVGRRIDGKRLAEG